ncbi:glutaredoxin family protein, partial [Piscinibacter sp.]|uniref:glutaredoxin family protein n=1 Tax=Piscinibacter sp. TaxID=1903157 RepID=UPI002C9800CB
MKKTLRWWVGMAPLVALFVALPSHALYKIIGPDGKVTYSDTPPPPGSGGKVIELGDSSNLAAVQPALPLELRQAMSRYPVTLYTMNPCAPCDAGRQLLRERGIPHTERLVATGEDSEALHRISGSRDAPTLTIGAQALRGLSTDVWHSYLDSAGYPRESRLPATYQFPAATPLTERRAAV